MNITLVNLLMLSFKVLLYELRCFFHLKRGVTQRFSSDLHNTDQRSHNVKNTEFSTSFFGSVALWSYKSDDGGLYYVFR